MDDLSVEELASNLTTYKDQLREVRKLIKEKKDDNGISEYVDMEKELQEVITLTEELLATANQSESAQNDALDDPSQSHEKFAVGTKVQAVYSDDGEWYNATIEGLTPIGYYVTYDNWGNKEEVDPANVRPLEAADALGQAEKEAEATKMALKRKIEQAATSDYQIKTLPTKLKIDPNDPEDVKTAKRKKIHAFKSKARFEQLEFAQNKRQNAWQQFQTTKGKAKKVGFFSGRQKESIFKSPEDHRGKVGVTGSGKGLTDFQRREKHLHLKDGSGDTLDDEE
ncbi:survival of motor neuron-related-splicing factor 30-like [Lolium rigidum]|uniref:survival of motor neuron-related-splicing factor 30-like n=1 Tax=Lolium rigidum TaxID=89674 RepID=UPI001F5D97C1|nr:survival of motor neuron-related-splicing factor 30-like [Lolium rigidum]